MKITITKQHLNDALQHIAKAIPGKPTQPILGGVRIEATREGLILTGSDTDISIQSFIPLSHDGQTIVDIHKTGSIVLTAKLFMELARKLPDSQVNIEVHDQWMTSIRSGSADIQLIGLDPEEYPALPDIDEHTRIQVPGHLLKSMIRQTTFAVATNESTPVLTGVLWTIQNGILKFTACDRHRLASKEAPIEIDPSFKLTNVVIAGKTLNELAKILPDQDELVDIIFADHQVLFQLNRLHFYTRVLDGVYPDTSKLIPQQFQTELQLSAGQFAEAIDRAYLLSREEKMNIVKMTMQDAHRVEVSSVSTEFGRVHEQIEISEFSGELLRISFNSKYMIDALKSMDSDRIHIGFTGSMQPIIIRPTEETGLMQLVLPFRTTN